MSQPRPSSVESARPERAELASILTRLENWSRLWRWRYGWTLRPLALAVVIRLLVFAAGVAGTRLIGPPVFSGLLNTWLQKDAIWYVNIASKGYFYQNGQPLSANFFPLYPLTIWIVQHFTGLFLKSDSYVAAGMLVAWAAFLAACVLLFRLVSDRFGEPTAYLAVLLLGIFPFSLFYGAPYTESLYLLCVVVAFLGIERDNWWLAATGALFAGATRPTGLIVGLAVAMAYLLDWIRTRHRLRFDLVSLALVPLGAVAFGIYCWKHFGDPLAYMKASEEGWHGHLQLGAITSAAHLLHHPDLWLQSERSFIGLIYVLLILAFLALCYPIYRLLGPSYAIYSLLSCIAPVLEFSQVKSSGRYMSVIFPGFIVLAYVLRGRPILRHVTLIGFTLLLGVAVTGYTSGYGIL